jgi:hypothetical protein
MQAFQTRELPLQVRKAPGNLLRLLLVIPQSRIGNTIAQRVGFPTHLVRVKHGFHAGERR